MRQQHSVIMLGATGAVGGQALQTLLTFQDISRVTLLGRRPVADLDDSRVEQHKIDIFRPETYRDHITDQSTAICTLGVGEPTKIPKDQFVRIDKDAVLDFAKACKAAGVTHFQLLCSVGASSSSYSFFLRIKGELEDALCALEFEKLSLFQPSMIMTPKNRYGLSQAITLAVWPILSHVLIGPLNKFRGIQVADLGSAIAQNIDREDKGVHRYQWADIVELASHGVKVS